MVWASSRADSAVFMKAPEPTLTSSTSAPVPSAIFLLMIEEAISGIDSTVPVTSRSAYSFLSAGASPEPAAQITAPTSSSWRSISRVAQRRPPAGDGLELVQGAAGVAESAAGQLRHRHPAGGDQGRQRQGDLVADPAGGVLVGGRPGQAGEVQPLAGVDHGLGPAPQLARASARGRRSPWPAPTSAPRRSAPAVYAAITQSIWSSLSSPRPAWRGSDPRRRRRSPCSEYRSSGPTPCAPR